MLTAVALTQESFEEAARLLGAAEAARQRLGTVRFPLEPQFWAGLERTARKALGGERYDAALAAGLTNRQIGERMFISPGTVKIHLSHIFAKLNTPTRSHLAAEATRRGAEQSRLAQGDERGQ